MTECRRPLVIRSLGRLRRPGSPPAPDDNDNVIHIRVEWTPPPSGTGGAFDELLRDLGPPAPVIDLAEVRAQRDRGVGPPRRPRRRRKVGPHGLSPELEELVRELRPIVDAIKAEARARRERRDRRSRKPHKGGPDGEPA